MKILPVVMFMLQIQICVLTFKLVASKENIHVKTGLSSHSFSTIMQSKFNPRANGAKRRSGRKPGVRVTNRA